MIISELNKKFDSTEALLVVNKDQHAQGFGKGDVIWTVKNVEINHPSSVAKTISMSLPKGILSLKRGQSSDREIELLGGLTIYDVEVPFDGPEQAATDVKKPLLPLTFT